MPGFIFDIPLLIAGPLLVIVISGLAVWGLLFVRRRVLPRLRFTEEDAVFSSTMVLAIMVFYGLTVALIAISVWEKYSEASSVVSQEATALGVLYRDASGYPQPVRTQLQDALREYVEYVIREAWPEQEKGHPAAGGVERVDTFERTLISFEPSTEGQRIHHAQTLQAYDRMLETRRLRLDAVETKLPGLMWAVTLIGAALGLIASYFFRVSDQRLQVILVVLLATFVAIVIFVILAFDRPFRGDMGIASAPYRLVYDQLMKR
jgi:cytochrome c oxidase subunit IV